MGRSLVIVESPAKAKTIKKDFEPTYTVLPGKSKILNEIKKLGKEADAIYVATDPDREGEAIGAHLVEFLTGTETAVEPEETSGNGKVKNGEKKAKKPSARPKSSRNKVD